MKLRIRQLNEIVNGIHLVWSDANLEIPNNLSHPKTYLKIYNLPLTSCIFTR